MPVRMIDLPDELDAAVDEMVKSGRHANSDEVVVTALERYEADIDAELRLAAQIDAGAADMAALEAFLERYRSVHTAPLMPITQEFKDRIEVLVGPVEEIDIDLEKAIEDE